MNDDHKLDQRLSRLEAVVESLASDVRAMATSWDAAIRDRRVNWGWIFAGIASAVVIIGFIIRSEVAPAESTSVRNAERVAVIEGRVNEQMQNDAYTRGRSDAEREQLRQDIDEIKHALRLRGEG